MLARVKRSKTPLNCTPLELFRYFAAYHFLRKEHA